MARLENWTLHNFQDKNGNTHSRLSGYVFGHPKANRECYDLTDGHMILTSDIVTADWIDGIIVTQSGTVYELGRKDEE